MVVFLIARKGIKELSIYWSNLRTGKVILVLMIYSFGGAGIFYIVEKKMTTPEELTFGTGCLARFDSYWASLNYVNTLYSTMGYGSQYCCSWLGRLLTCIYIFIGTPILLIVLEAIGKVLANVCTHLWTMGGRFVHPITQFIKRIVAVIFCKQRPSSVLTNVEEGKEKAEEKKAAEDEEEQMIPLSAGLGLSIIWLLGAGLYFHYLEGWTYGSSLYFLFISITTVGLGDFSPTKYEYTVITYMLLFVGLSLMSMCLAILQNKIENMVKRIQADIQRRRNSLPAGMEALPEDEKKSDGLFGKLVGNPEEKILKMMLTTNQQKMVEGNDKSQSVQNARTQTRAPATVTTVKLCDEHKHYAEVKNSNHRTVINEGDELTLTDSGAKNSFKNQFARIATDEIFTIADNGVRGRSTTSSDCIICRALRDNKPPTPPPPPPPPKSATPDGKPKWRM